MHLMRFRIKANEKWPRFSCAYLQPFKWCRTSAITWKERGYHFEDLLSNFCHVHTAALCFLYCFVLRYIQRGVFHWPGHVSFQREEKTPVIFSQRSQECSRAGKCAWVEGPTYLACLQAFVQRQYIVWERDLKRRKCLGVTEEVIRLLKKDT